MGRRRYNPAAAALLALAAAHGVELPVKRKRGSKSSHCPDYVPSPSAALGFNLPLKLALTQNDLDAHRYRRGGKARRQVKKGIKNAVAEATAWHGANLKATWHMVDGKLRRKEFIDPKRRRVVVTRYTSGQCDDAKSVDAIGGKMVMDALVSAGVLVDDSPQWCERVGRVEPAKAGQGYLTVEVFEL